MTDRREYMREYKRRYRAAKNITKHDGDAFLSLSCLSVEEADARQGGAITGWALVFENGDELHGDGVSSLLDGFKSVKTRNTIYLCNLKVWGRFFVVEAERRKMTVSDNTAVKNTYRVVVNATGDWNGFEFNLDGNRVFIKSFSEIIRSPLDKAFKDFCGGALSDDADNTTIARAMYFIMQSFRASLKKLSGGVSFTANTISGYAQKLCEIIAGKGCPEYGRDVYKAFFPEIPREYGDDLRAAKVYRSGWNYMHPDAVNYTGDGYILDVNSFYPSIYAERLPVGDLRKSPYVIYEMEKPESERDYGIFKVMELSAHIKPGAVPTIQIINYDDCRTKYLTDVNYTGGAPFMLDTFDIDLLYKNYDVDYLTLEYGYFAKLRHVDFLENYAYLLFNRKRSHKGDAVGATAKYLLNSLSGRFGLNSYRREVDIVKNNNYNGEYKYIGEKGYLPAAIYINSVGRYRINEYVRICGDRFLYSDTDSIIIKGDEIPKELQQYIGQELGQLSVKRFTACKFFGLKCYGVETLFDGWQWTIAGASPQMLKELKDDVHAGQVLRGGVVPKMYPNGTIAFKEREFTLARKMIF